MNYSVDKCCKVKQITHMFKLELNIWCQRLNHMIAKYFALHLFQMEC